MGFGATMVFENTDQGSAGILIMINVDLQFLEDHRRFNWFTDYYSELERLLLRSAEDMLSQKTKE